MIHFSFTVRSADAENILRAMREQALENDISKMHYLSRHDLTDEQKESYCQALDENKEYMIGLIAKMNNTRIS